jgi:magnesium chelatase family protein
MSGYFPSSRWWLLQPQGSGQPLSGGASDQDASFLDGRPKSLIAEGRLWPAAFVLSDSDGKKATQECPCGYYGDPFKECKCSPGEIFRYQKRISGPLLDRIDIFVDVPHIDYEKLTSDKQAESSKEVRERIEAAHQIQLERFKGAKSSCNADMTPMEVREFCTIEPSAKSLLGTAMKQLHLTARTFHRILKLSRTIADLENSDIIKIHRVAEAL